jgi:hypothetical protein
MKLEESPAHFLPLAGRLKHVNSFQYLCARQGSQDENKKNLFGCFTQTEFFGSACIYGFFTSFIPEFKE